MNRFIKEGLITTSFGIMILIFAGILMYQQKYSATDLSGWITVGVLFLRSKDSLIGLPKNKDDEDGQA